MRKNGIILILFQAINLIFIIRLIYSFQAKKGLLPIEQIKIGDRVLSYNEKTKQYEYKVVARTFTAIKENIVKLKIAGEKKAELPKIEPYINFWQHKRFSAGKIENFRKSV